MATNLGFPIFKAFTTTGTLAGLSGGKLYTYEAGTATPKATYTDSTLGTPHANPVILDANGEKEIWLGSGAYKLDLDSSTDVQQPNFPIDNVQSETQGGTSSSVASIVALRALSAGASTFVDVARYYASGGGGGDKFEWQSSNSDSDDGGVTIIPDTLPATGRWVRIFTGDVSVEAFGAKGDYIVGGAVNGSAQDNTATFNNTFTYCNDNGKAARIPDGAFLVTGALNCAVSLIGDQKGALITTVVYGSASWNTGAPSNLEGSCIVWDNTVLGVGDVHLRNIAGADSKNVKYKNITFYSLSDTGVGGGKLLVNDDVQSGTEFDYGDLETFEDCHIANFTTALTVNVFNTWTVSDVIFKGCQQVMLAGNDTPEEATNIKFVNCTFEQCGDATTAFFQLDNVQGFQFDKCSFSGTSEISIRIALNQGLSFTGCYINDSSLGGSGDFLEVVATAGFNCDNVSFYNCTGGSTMGDINLIQGANIATLTLFDCDFGFTDVQSGASKLNILQLGKTVLNLLDGTPLNQNLLSSSLFNMNTTGAMVLDSNGTISLDCSDVNLNTAGSGFGLKESGAAAKSGLVTLTTGNATVTTSAVGSNSRIILSRQARGSSSAIGDLSVDTRSNGVSFVIIALNAANGKENGDLSDVYWQLIDVLT